MMTEYVVMHVLRLHRDVHGYQAAQTNREWRRTTIVRPEQRRVGFLTLFACVADSSRGVAGRLYNAPN